MITGYITLEESTIRSFIEDPEYAEHLMSVVIADGDKEEILKGGYLKDTYDIDVKGYMKRQYSHWI